MNDNILKPKHFDDNYFTLLILFKNFLKFSKIKKS